SSDLDVARASGHAYSNKSPFTAFAALPFYEAGRVLKRIAPLVTTVGHDAGRPEAFYTLLLPALAGALNVLLVFRLGRRLGAGPAGATLAALVLAFGTLQWRYATALYSHALSAAAVLATTLWALDVRQRPADL